MYSSFLILSYVTSFSKFKAGMMKNSDAFLSRWKNISYIIEDQIDSTGLSLQPEESKRTLLMSTNMNENLRSDDSDQTKGE